MAKHPQIENELSELIAQEAFEELRSRLVELGAEAWGEADIAEREMVGRAWLDVHADYCEEHTGVRGSVTWSVDDEAETANLVLLGFPDDVDDAENSLAVRAQVWASVQFPSMGAVRTLVDGNAEFSFVAPKGVTSPRVTSPLSAEDKPLHALQGDADGEP